MGGWVAPGWMGGARVGGWVGGARVGGWVGGARVGGWVVGARVDGWRPGGGVVGGARVRGGFRHFGCSDQIGLKPGCAQNHSFWALWLFIPNWAEARICPKTLVFGILHGYLMGGAGVGGWLGGARVDGWRPGGWVGWWRPAGWVDGWRMGVWLAPGWVGGWVAPGWVSGARVLGGFWHPGSLDQIGLKPECAQKHSFGHSGSSDQIGLKPECAQKHSFSAFWLFGLNWAQARMCPKIFVFGILAVRTTLGPSPNVPKNIRFRHSGCSMGGARMGGWVGGARVGVWVVGARVDG